MRSNILCLLVLAALPLVARAQVKRIPADSIWTVEIRELVVTATRTPRELEDVPVSVRLVTRAQALEQGSVRISDMLEEFAELRVIRNHFGAGLQLRGLDPAYTLILIDGQPITGRTGGTIDLDRIPASLIERVEIVRGPSSSLYGSEALAGVVNIITRGASQGPAAELGVQRETHGTSNMTATLSGANGPFSGRLSANTYASDGYDLIPDSPGQTVPSFSDHSFSGHVGFDRSRFKVNLRGRYARVSQLTAAEPSATPFELLPEQHSGRNDWNVAADVTARPTSQLRSTTSLFVSNSNNFTDLLDGNQVVRTDFAQTYRKAESIWDTVLGLRHHLTLGGGVIRETAAGERIAGGTRATTAEFAFAQHEFAPAGKLQITSSVRVDRHSDYATHTSPKLAGLLSVGRLRFRLSAARGFKAPTFQQLYLDFTNPGSGYSVIGTSDLSGALALFQSAGQVAYLLGDPSAISTLRPETAQTYELGIDGDLAAGLRVRTSVFATRLRDMIETQPIAGKPNGQFIFSYVNLGRVEIRGLNVDANWQPISRLSFGVGYQFLQARDLDILDQIDRGSLFRRVDGRDHRVSRKDYGGLFNRPTHTVTLRTAVTWGRTHGLVRIIYRDRYGLADLNGNLVLDDQAEYAPAYTLVNVTMNRDFGPRLSASIGVRNLTDKIFPTLVPALSGRIIQAGVRLKLLGSPRIQ